MPRKTRKRKRDWAGLEPVTKRRCTADLLEISLRKTLSCLPTELVFGNLALMEWKRKIEKVNREYHETTFIASTDSIMLAFLNRPVPIHVNHRDLSSGYNYTRIYRSTDINEIPLDIKLPVNY